MSVKKIKVKVGNNLNAIVKGGTNVNVVVTFKPKDTLTVSTPEIPGGGGYEFILEYDSEKLELTIDVGANTLGDASVITIIPLNANELHVDLQGAHNGKIDIQTSFK